MADSYVYFIIGRDIEHLEPAESMFSFLNVFIPNQPVHIRLKGLIFHAIAQAGYAGFKSVFLRGLK